jgi:hypothetical protein
MIFVLSLFESLPECSGGRMVGLTGGPVEALGKIAVVAALAELVVGIELVEVGVVMVAEVVVSGLETGEVGAGIAVAKAVGVAAGERIVVGRTACCVDPGFGSVAVVFLPLAFAVPAVTAAGLTRTGCIPAGFDTVVADADSDSDAVDAIVADIAAAAAGKDIVVDVAAVVVVADALVDFGLPGSSDIAARIVSDTKQPAAAAVQMVALAAAVLLRSNSFAREDIWMLE